MKLGSSDVSDLKLGASAVSKVMLGAAEVWSPPGGPSWDFLETFEASSYDNPASWSKYESGDGVVDPDYTGIILEGSKSLRLYCPSSDQSVSYLAVPSLSEMFVYFQMQFVVLPTIGETFWSAQAATTNMLSLERYTANVIRLRCGSAGINTVATIATGQKYHCWVYYLKGTGSNAVAKFGFSTDTTEPTSGNYYVERTTGTSTSDIDRIVHGHQANKTYEMIVDRVIYNSTTIGNAP